jgi:hypothetical protein
MKLKRRLGVSVFIFAAIIAVIMAATNKGFASSLKRFDVLANQNIGFEERAKKGGLGEVKKVPILRPSNKNSTDKLKPIEQMSGYIKDELLKDGITHIKKQLLTYEEFLEQYTEMNLNPAIDKDRMIWVTVTHYPNGYQHKRGFVKNAILTTYNDAETGELYGYSLKSLEKGGNGIKKQ